MIESKGGLVYRDPWADLTLRALGAFTSTALVAEAAVANFGGFRVLVVDVEVSSVSFTGGTDPTVVLQTWLQRQSPTEGWDDVLAIATAALSAGAAVYRYVAEHRVDLGTAAAPAALLDCNGSPPVASRGGWLSDSLRLKSKLVLGGSVAPSAASVTWRALARGRP